MSHLFRKNIWDILNLLSNIWDVKIGVSWYGTFVFLAILNFMCVYVCVRHRNRSPPQSPTPHPPPPIWLVEAIGKWSQDFNENLCVCVCAVHCLSRRRVQGSGQRLFSGRAECPWLKPAWTSDCLRERQSLLSSLSLSLPLSLVLCV